MITSARVLRQWHAYIGLLIAPSVLFFALTGAVQLFGLHERHGDYQPAVLLEKLASLHKDQVFEKHQEPPPLASRPDTVPSKEKKSDDDADKVQPKTMVLKWFLLIVALGLSVSTVIGIWMGLTQLRNKRLGWALVIAGALIPMSLIVI